jgi:hypothetical protein
MRSGQARVTDLIERSNGLDSLSVSTARCHSLLFGPGHRPAFPCRVSQPDGYRGVLDAPVDVRRKESQDPATEPRPDRVLHGAGRVLARRVFERQVERRGGAVGGSEPDLQPDVLVVDQRQPGGGRRVQQSARQDPRHLPADSKRLQGRVREGLRRVQGRHRARCVQRRVQRASEFRRRRPGDGHQQLRDRADCIGIPAAGAATGDVGRQEVGHAQ